MKRLLALFLCLLIPGLALAGENSYKVKYDGGSLTDVKPGNEVKLVIEADKIKFMDGSKELVTVPASAVTEISYGQDVHRRVGSAVAVGTVTLGVGALMALTKSKKHFVGLTWADGDKKGGLAMQCDKNEYRGILAALEGITGKKAVNSDTMTVKN
ncbi:MAG: hypothetical protein ACM3JB_07750 [Acidobacteriaceae bacterium]